MEQFEAQLLRFINQEMQQDLAHDINHVLRVVKTAKRLCQQEHAKAEVVLPAAYLHDCFSFAKNHPQRSTSSLIAADKAIKFLSSIGYPNEHFAEIHHAIVAHSFSAAVPPETLEAQVVQDADRLDALGAIGIARCLQVSASLGVGLYDSNDPFCHIRKPNDRNFTIDHFYIKLLKLADSMQTASAKVEAKKRTKYMQAFLQQLESEV